MRVLVICDEELAAICILATVGHGDNATLGVLEGINDFIWKLAVWGRVYAFATLACASRVTALCSVVTSVMWTLHTLPVLGNQQLV